MPVLIWCAHRREMTSLSQEHSTIKTASRLRRIASTIHKYLIVKFRISQQSSRGKSTACLSGIDCSGHASPSRGAIINCCQHVGETDVATDGLSTGLQVSAHLAHQRIALIVLISARAVEHIGRRKVGANQRHSDLVRELRDRIPRLWSHTRIKCGVILERPASGSGGGLKRGK